MSEKSFKKSEFKRTIDLGKTDRGQDTDLIRVWRESSGEEKAISLGDINGGLIGDYVPYTGAVDDVDLGEKGITAGYVKYDTTPTSTPTDQGTSYWDIDDNTLAIIMNGTTLKVGEDQYYPVKNQTGVLIPKGTAVRFAGTLGSSGRLLIAPFLADGSFASSRFMGVTSEDIDNGEDGKVMWFGRIRGLNTNAFNEGDVLYASTTVAGGFQTTAPTPPNNIVEVCAVVHKSASNGIIFVRPSFITSIEAGAGLSLDSLNRIQLGKEPYEEGRVVDLSEWGTVANGSEFIITNSISSFASEQIFNVWNYPAQNGFLFNAYKGPFASSIFLDSRKNGANEAARSDFSVYGSLGNIGLYLRTGNYAIGLGTNYALFEDSVNNKGIEYLSDYEANFTARSLVTKQYVDGAISGAGHSPVTIDLVAPNGLSIDASQVLSIGLASTSATGALSSTDWNTFNNKLNLTSPITGYIVGANTALAATDTILQAFGKVQGQINARISGTIASGQVAFGTGVNTVGGDSGLIWDNTNKRIDVGASQANKAIFRSTLAAGNNFLDFVNTTGRQSYIGMGTANDDFFIVNAKNNAITFATNNTNRWQILATGVLQSNGSQTINSIGGELRLTTSGGTNSNIIIAPQGTGLVMVGPSGTPTNTLDVNGTARIRTISNLGTAATSVLVPSATGVVSLRTLAELSADMGNAWTSVGSGNIFRNSRISVGHTADPTESIDLGASGWLKTGQGASNAGGVILPFSNLNIASRSWAIQSDGNSFGEFTIKRSATQAGDPKTGTLSFAINNTGDVAIGGIPFSFGNFTYFSVIGKNTTSGGSLIIRTSDNSFSFQTVVSNAASSLISSGNIPMVFSVNGSERFRVFGNGNFQIGGTTDLGFKLHVVGSTFSQGIFQMTDGGTGNIVFGTTTGSKIGTATNQRLSFWGKTPIVQPTNAIGAGAFVANTSGIANDTATYGGYTMGQIAQALINVGILA